VHLLNVPEKPNWRNRMRDGSSKRGERGEEVKLIGGNWLKEIVFTRLQWRSSLKNCGRFEMDDGCCKNNGSGGGGGGGAATAQVAGEECGYKRATQRHDNDHIELKNQNGKRVKKVARDP
jgi:hypothetical protein